MGPELFPDGFLSEPLCELESPGLAHIYDLLPTEAEYLSSHDEP